MSKFGRLVHTNSPVCYLIRFFGTFFTGVFTTAFEVKGFEVLFTIGLVTVLATRGLRLATAGTDFFAVFTTVFAAGLPRFL
jgi:uncharacterized membrane protein